MSGPHSKRLPKLVSYIVSPPVRQAMADHPDQPVDVIITLAETPGGGLSAVEPSKRVVKNFIQALHYDTRLRESDHYIFASLLPKDISQLSKTQEVYTIWLDDKCDIHLLQSVETVKATACWRTFDARGKDITWAVLDTGIRYDHPHFLQHSNINRQLSKNYSASPVEEDRNGHGTHVAGIIAGCAAAPADGSSFQAATYLESETDAKLTALESPPSGVAPMARLINVKVLDDEGSGSSSNAILGLEYLRKLNQSSRQILVDGANMSLGYPFDPKWYGCGHSPLCQEVRRTVRSGICGGGVLRELGLRHGEAG